MEAKTEFKLIDLNKSLKHNKVKLIQEPKFRKTKSEDFYYFDWINETIYGYEKYTKKYFHEYQHYLDFKNKPWYKNFVFKLSLWNQFMNQLMGIIIIIATVWTLIAAGVTGNYGVNFYIYYKTLVTLSIFYMAGMSIVILPTFLDEVRADVHAKRMFKKFCIEQEIYLLHNKQNE